jgi:hypothetical protein
MKKSTLFFYILLLGLLAIFGTNMTFQAMTNKNIQQVFSDTQKELRTQTSQSSVKCINQTPIIDLKSANDNRIRKLDEYQSICKSLVTDKLMLFTDMPNSNVTAVTNAKKMIATLKEFEKYKITPVVIVEPITKWGLIDFLEFNTGFYDSWIKTYFQTLKKEGVTDVQMGIWVPFPEANIPSWNKGNAKPKDFALGVNKYLSIMKSSFPHAKGSILLNSATYDNDDEDWAYGEYISLMPYVSDIDKTLVDSFGLQGFPWLPERNSPSDGLTDPSEYLRYLLAVEAAESLGVKEVWFNTGTFGGKYMMDPTKKISVNAASRKFILDNTLLEVKKVQERGFKVWVNIFAEDKSDVTEQTDWSYWHTVGKEQTPEMIIFKDFIYDLNENKIGISLYDSYKDTDVTPTPFATLQVIRLQRTPTPRPTLKPEPTDEIIIE